MRNHELLKYAGMATQFLVILGIAVFAGYKADHYFHFSFPLLTVTLPLLALCVTFWKIYKDSSPRHEK